MCPKSMSKGSAVLSVAEIAALVHFFDGSYFKIGGEKWSPILNPLAAGAVYYMWTMSEYREMLKKKVDVIAKDIISDNSVRQAGPAAVAMLEYTPSNEAPANLGLSEGTVRDRAKFASGGGLGFKYASGGF